MKLNFKGFFKAAGLFPLALMLSGCISYALVSHTAKGSSGKYQSQSVDWPPESPDNQYHLNK